MDINEFAKFDEIPSLPVQDIKETPKRRGRMEGWMDLKTVYNVKTVYPPPNKVCGDKIKQIVWIQKPHSFTLKDTFK